MTPVGAGPRAAVQIERDELELFQRTARLLLAHPLVTESWPRPGALALVRRWEPVLRNEFGRVLGYRLDVGRSCARLYRRAATTSTHRGPHTRTQRPMGRLACSFLCLTLAALESLGDQTTASQLSHEILRLRSGDDALPVDLTQYDQRRAFVDAVKWLEDRGGLRLCDGTVDLWLADETTGDALYDINGDALSRLLVASPSVLRDVGEPADFLVDQYAPSEDGQRNRVRHRIGRRLIDEPVLSYADLDDDELAHIRHRRTRLIGDLEQLTGCTIESRTEGLVLVDAPVEPLSRELFPGTGTETQAALLWGAALVEQALVDQASALPVISAQADRADGPPDPSTAMSPWRVVPAEIAAEKWDAIVVEYRSRFRADYREAPGRLYREVVALLDRFGLATIEADGSVRCHGALARYRPATTGGNAIEPDASLFDEVDVRD
jgi:uncharacterized protein (TIGR02678 family)